MSNTERKYTNVVSENLYFAKQLDSLGFNRKYLGYYMLIEIMDMLINKNMQIVSFSKQVYPLIASKYNKTYYTIERNIRSLIKKTWCVNLMKIFNKYFPQGQLPTCRDFIFMVKNYITNKIV